MKKLASAVFIYDDGSRDEIIDQRAALLLQSRMNSSGIMSGMEDFIIMVKNESEPSS